MPTFDDMTEVPRKVFPIFLIPDTSYRKSKTYIMQLNNTVESLLEVFKLRANHNSETLYKIGVLECNSSCKWMNPDDLDELMKFQWKNLVLNGKSDFKGTFSELNLKLTTNGFLKFLSGIFPPLIVFLTDGYTNYDYKRALNELRMNVWFERSRKIGIALGDNPNIAVISEFVGNSESVIRPYDLGLVKKAAADYPIPSSICGSFGQAYPDEFEPFSRITIDDNDNKWEDNDRKEEKMSGSVMGENIILPIED